MGLGLQKKQLPQLTIYKTIDGAWEKGLNPIITLCPIGCSCRSELA